MLSFFGGGRRKRYENELKLLASRKTLSEEDARRCRDLMRKDWKQRPTLARILEGFKATEEWQISVTQGETVAVLDKLDDGWWVIDKSCGAGRGPFGLVPGMQCCWSLKGAEDASSREAKAEAAGQNEAVENESRQSEAPVSTPDESPPEKTYTEDDLEDAYAYLEKLINGDGFQARPPADFNDNCLDPEFSRLVKERADLLRANKKQQIS